jgi:ABC-type phosphate transport system substrate-binding protein
MANLLRKVPVSCLVLAVLLASARLALAGDFVVLCNKANPVSSLSKSDLRKLFTGGKKQWDSGAVVQVGLIASDAPETTFLSGLFGMSPRELLQRIQEQVFKGEMKRPVVLRSSADCAAFARSNPGAICVATAMPAPPDTHVVAVQ